MSSRPKNKKNSASKSSFPTARAKPKPKNTGGREKQKKQSLSKDEARKVWSEHKKNSEKDFQKKFVARKKYAQDQLKNITTGKVAQSKFSKKQIAYFKDMGKSNYKEYRANNLTPAEVDENTWDNRVVTSGNPIARTSRRRKKPIPWAKDPSKSDYPFIDHPSITSEQKDVLKESNYWEAKKQKKPPTDRDFVKYKRDLGNQFIDVNDSRQMLKEVKNRFDNLFNAKADELEKENIISSKERIEFQKNIETIIKNNSKYRKWNTAKARMESKPESDRWSYRVLELQKSMFNEEKLVKKKLEIAEAMKQDFSIIQSLSNKISGMKTTQYSPKRGEETDSDKALREKNQNKRELRYLRYGDPQARNLLERIDERKRLERAIDNTSDPTKKRKLQNTLSTIIGDNRDVKLRIGHTISQPNGRGKTFNTKVSDNDYQKILAKAEGIYGKHALVRDAINRQETYLKSNHNKHILNTRKVPRLRGKLTYLSNHKINYEQRIMKLEEKLKNTSDSKQKTVLRSKINNLIYGDRRAQDILEKISTNQINPLKKQEWEKVNIKALGLEGIKKERILSTLELASIGSYGMEKIETELSKEIESATKTAKETQFKDRFFIEDTKLHYLNLKKDLEKTRQSRIDEEKYIDSLRIITPRDYIDYEKELGNWDNLNQEETIQLKELVSQYQKTNTKQNRANWVEKVKNVESPKVMKNLDIYLLYFSDKSEKENRQLRKGIKMPRSFEKKLTDIEKKLQYEMDSTEVKELNKQMDSLMTEVELTAVENLQFDMAVPPEQWENYIKERLSYKK